jgi:hypothetical protein
VKPVAWNDTVEALVFTVSCAGAKLDRVPLDSTAATWSSLVLPPAGSE